MKHKIKEVQTENSILINIYCPIKKKEALAFKSGFKDDENLGEHVHCPLCKEVISI